FRQLRRKPNMATPQRQLETWPHQGATNASAPAYRRIELALQASAAPLLHRSIEIFLQGSYRNATNVYGHGDIDVVVMSTDTFYSNKHLLPVDQRMAHEAHYSPSTYEWSQLRAETIVALCAAFGPQAVSPGSKSIKVRTGIGSKDADVVPAMEFRRYSHF